MFTDSGSRTTLFRGKPDVFELDSTSRLQGLAAICESALRPGGGPGAPETGGSLEHTNAMRTVTHRVTVRHHFGIHARHAHPCARRDAKEPVCSENTLDPLCSPAPCVVVRLRNSSPAVACRTPCSPLRSGVMNEPPKGVRWRDFRERTTGESCRRERRAGATAATEREESRRAIRGGECGGKRRREKRAAPPGDATRQVLHIMRRLSGRGCRECGPCRRGCP